MLISNDLEQLLFCSDDVNRLLIDNSHLVLVVSECCKCRIHLWGSFFNKLEHLIVDDFTFFQFAGHFDYDCP